MMMMMVVMEMMMVMMKTVTMIMTMSIVEQQVKTLKSWWFQNLTFVIWVIIITSVWLHGNRSTNIGPEWGIRRIEWPFIRVFWGTMGGHGGALWSRACPQNILC